MNGWEALRSDPGGGYLARAVVDVGPAVLNQRSEPVYQDRYIIGAWPSHTELLVCDVLKAAEPPGEWLLCQPASGPVLPVAWAHSSGIFRVIDGQVRA